jgi:hypothetical protein
LRADADDDAGRCRAERAEIVVVAGVDGMFSPRSGSSREPSSWVGSPKVAGSGLGWLAKPGGIGPS